MKKFAKTATVTILLVSLLTLTLVCFTSCDEGVGYLPETAIRLPISKSTSLGNLPVGLLVANEHSFLELTADGICNISIMLNISELVPLLNEIIDLEATLSTLDKSQIEKIYVDGYVNVMFPGFTIGDIKTSLSLIKNCLGLEIVGYDAAFQKVDMFTQNDMFMSLVATIEDETTNAMFPEGFDLAGLPAWLGIEISAPYSMLDITAENGTKYNAVLVGPHDANSMPLITMGYDQTTETVTWTNEMLGLKLVAKNDKA